MEVPQVLDGLHRKFENEMDDNWRYPLSIGFVLKVLGSVGKAG